MFSITLFQYPLEYISPPPPSIHPYSRHHAPPAAVATFNGPSNLTPTNTAAIANPPPASPTPTPSTGGSTTPNSGLMNGQLSIMQQNMNSQPYNINQSQQSNAVSPVNSPPFFQASTQPITASATEFSPLHDRLGNNTAPRVTPNQYVELFIV